MNKALTYYKDLLRKASYLPLRKRTEVVTTIRENFRRQPQERQTEECLEEAKQACKKLEELLTGHVNYNIVKLNHRKHLESSLYQNTSWK